MATLRYKAGSRAFDVAIQETIEETRRVIIATAHREHGTVLKTDPRPARWQQFVDGIEGGRFEAVKGNGVIIIDYDRLDVVVQFAMETLFDKSPVLSGAYRNSHTIFVDGVAVTNLKDRFAGGEVVISNTVPYARKIELGRMTMRAAGSDHVYAQAEQIVRRRFGNVADVRFTYRGIIGTAIATSRDHGKSGLRYPALAISPAGSRSSRRLRR